MTSAADGGDPGGLRSLARDAVRTEVARRAIAFIDQRGFDEATVDEIAAAAGISPRSFFRYFPTKEDVAIGDLLPMGRLIEAELQGRPATENPWRALRMSLTPLVEVADADPASVLRSSRVALSTAALRAKTLERHSAWAALLTPVLLSRANTRGTHSGLVAGALVQSALSCLYVATVAWVAADGEESYGRLLEIAFEAVRPLDLP